MLTGQRRHDSAVGTTVGRPRDMTAAAWCAGADEGLVTRDIWRLRLRALLAWAHGDAADYAHLRDRYRDMAKTLGFEGHVAWAEAMA